MDSDKTKDLKEELEAVRAELQEDLQAKEQPKGDTSAEENAAVSPSKSKKRTPIAVCAAICACILLVAGFGLGVNSAANEDVTNTAEDTAIEEEQDSDGTTEAEAEDTDEETQTVSEDSDDADTEECSHDWSITYETVHHDAVTHTETVDAVYEDVTSYHTVCNECQEIIDGEASAHIKETEHSGYSTNVPITDTVVSQEAYSYTVTDTPAYDELVADEMVCTLCGETKSL